MNQSEFEANACNRRQARENACEQGAIGFGFLLVEKVAQVLLTNHTSRSKTTRKQTRTIFDTIKNHASLVILVY